MKLRSSKLLFFSFLAGQALAQTPTEAPAEVTVLRAARMLDVVAGEIVQDAVVVIEGERILSVNPSSTPRGAKNLDLGDVTLVPGLMDLHTHLGHDLEPGFWMLAVTEGPADVAYRSVGNARKTLMAGFTTVRDFGGQVTVALSRAEEKGRVQSPRVIPSRYSLGITGGHCDVTGFAPGIQELGPEEGIADGIDEVIEAVRYQIKHGAKVIKTCATAGVLSFEGPVGAQQYTDEELRAMVEEAGRHGVKVAAHAHGTEGIIAAVRAGVASIEHGSILDAEAIQLMKEKGTYLVPTTYLADAIDLDRLPPSIRAKAEYVMPLAKESLRQAIRAGVKIAFGTDSAVYPHGENPREFLSLVDRGMSPLEAVRTATLYAADLLGLEDRGVIEAGRLADLVAVPGDPTQRIDVMEQVGFVMKGGKVEKRP